MFVGAFSEVPDELLRAAGGDVTAVTADVTVTSRLWGLKLEKNP